MKVKKLPGSDWKPSENMGLQAGDVIDMTDPRQLILDGKCVAVGEDGQELDSFDLYGVISDNLMTDLRDFKKAQHQMQIKNKLEAEKDVLTAELKELKASNAKKLEASDLDKIEWKELRQKAIDAGVFKPKMKKIEIIAALVEKAS